MKTASKSCSPQLSETSDQVELFTDGINTFASVDNRMIGLMRFLLALSALLIIFIDPTEPNRLVEITYLTLILYCLYSGVLYLFSIRNLVIIPHRFIHWLDIGWYLILISLSLGTSSIFFYFFYFSILVASFRQGFASGLYVTVTSAVIFTIVGYTTAPDGQEFEMNRFLLRPICLMVLGYMISYWGGSEIASRHRLTLLNNLGKISNPRFGVDQTIELLIDKLLTFYEADACLLITDIADEDGYQLYEKISDRPVTIEKTNAVSSLIKLPDKLFIFYRSHARFYFTSPKCISLDPLNGNKEIISIKKYQALADLLETKNFITAPLLQHQELIGRVYLTSNSKSFNESDLIFLRQIFEYLLPIIENIKLLDKLASVAAEQQRSRISRDIHDSTIQPYIGLKLGLESLQIKYQSGKLSQTDLENLIKLADSGISDLRRFIQDLESEEKGIKTSVLMSAVEQKTAQFKEYYGIWVKIEAPPDFSLNDRLSAEIFQIVVEGLSNIRRHTTATKAIIRFHLDQSKFILEIENPIKNKAIYFSPKSINGRVADLGGSTRVINSDTFTKIKVEIPL
jgi:signal transduction histidine kinase